jgi:hypothetical protein
MGCSATSQMHYTFFRTCNTALLQGADDEDEKQAAAAGSKSGKGLTKAQAAEAAAAAVLSKHMSM